jgi:hypothetical protein
MPFTELSGFADIEQGNFGFVVQPCADKGCIDESCVVSD